MRILDNLSYFKGRFYKFDPYGRSAGFNQCVPFHCTVLSMDRIAVTLKLRQMSPAPKDFTVHISHQYNGVTKQDKPIPVTIVFDN